jgi:hypothetical protein
MQQASMVQAGNELDVRKMVRNLLLVCGALAGLRGARIAAQLPTPWLGVMERVNVYSSLLWVAVLAITLLGTEKEQA